MANHSGNSGDVTVGANIVAEVLDFSLTESAATIENSALGDAADTHIVGSTNWNGSINCYWDETDSTGQEAMTIGASVALHLRPEGAGTTNIDFNGTATIETIERGLSRNGMVTAAFTFKGNGALTRTVL